MRVVSGALVGRERAWPSVVRIQLRAPGLGTVGPGQVFFDPPVPMDKRAPPDGMSIDEQGNLYLSGSGGVWVVDKFGRSLGLIAIPEFCSNVTFGGPDGKTLYFTCAKQVYSLAAKVRGGQFVRKNK